jgi:hypothetical protein
VKEREAVDTAARQRQRTSRRARIHRA